MYLIQAPAMCWQQAFNELKLTHQIFISNIRLIILHYLLMLINLIYLIRSQKTEYHNFQYLLNYLYKQTSQIDIAVAYEPIHFGASHYVIRKHKIPFLFILNESHLKACHRLAAAHAMCRISRGTERPSGIESTRSRSSIGRVCRPQGLMRTPNICLNVCGLTVRPSTVCCLYLK